MVLAGASLAACATVQGPMTARSGMGANGTMRPYEVNGTWYRPAYQPHYQKEGIASWYGAQFHNARTADGEIFDMDQPSAAHTTLPLPCIVEVTNLENGRRLKVRVNDRGPFVGGRLIDLSREAARELGFYDRGTARVRVRYLGPAAAGEGRTSARSARAPTPRLDAPIGTRAMVQAGAFADLPNAQRALATLSVEGSATIAPLDVGGVRFYRVLVASAPGEDPQALRDKVVAAGFPGARVVDGS